MKSSHVIILVAGASLLTFLLSVIFSINMVSIPPKNLAEVIKKDPERFIMAVKEASDLSRKQAEEREMEEQFKNPKDIPIKGRVTFGPESAPVNIVEFSDFQCQYCQRMAQVMSALRKKYQGKVNLIYKHFPLSFHPFARPAAEYFEAIALIDHEQARKFHDFIFDNFSDYARLKGEKEIKKSLKAIVKELGLDMNAVEKNMAKAKEVVKQDEEEAMRLNVRGTPSLFVNGIRVTGNVEQVIERLLKDM